VKSPKGLTRLGLVEKKMTHPYSKFHGFYVPKSVSFRKKRGMQINEVSPRKRKKKKEKKEKKMKEKNEKVKLKTKSHERVN